MLLLNVDTCNLLYPNRQLQPPSTALCGHGRIKIDVVGLLCLPVRCTSTTVDCFPFHITRHGEPLLHIPQALWDGITHEFQRLQAAGIIEPIDASPWMSNLVIARKKSGGLRVCVDLRQVNKAVEPDK